MPGPYVLVVQDTDDHYAVDAVYGPYTSIEAAKNKANLIDR